jgi:adenosyl cobinamide kinase/adenosyl cobinamide phosphate guanylyltransferase
VASTSETAPASPDDAQGSLTVLLGGARSGKSALAVRWGQAFDGPVTCVVTGWAGDDEMRQRIARHRAERPAGWTTVEERRDVSGALSSAEHDALVFVDCLTLWVANVFHDLDDAAVHAAAQDIGAAAAGRAAPTVNVSNEVGQGIVPSDPATRRDRDLLGGVNATVTDHAARAWLLVAGRLLALHAPEPRPTGLV